MNISSALVHLTLAALVIIDLSIFGGFLMFHSVPKGNEQFLTYILGTLSGALPAGALGLSVGKHIAGQADPTSSDVGTTSQ